MYEYKAGNFPYPKGKAGVKRSRIQVYFQASDLEVGINLDEQQGCQTDQRRRRDMLPKATRVVGKVEEQRTLKAIVGTTAIVPMPALPSESTELIHN